MYRLLLFLALLAIGCTKEEKTPTQCYTCTFGVSVTGVQYPPKDTCVPDGFDIGRYTFKDPAGNELNSQCVAR